MTAPGDPTTSTPPGGTDGQGAPAAMPGGEIRITLFGRTDVGQVREHNEDNFLVADLTRKSRGLHETDRQVVLGPRGHVLGVCDGMGGAAAGEVASQLAVDIVFEKMTSSAAPKGRDDFARRLVQAVEAAGLRIFSEAKLDRARRGMGTTATIAGLVDDHLFLAQVGDSRAYILRGERLVQVTRDQSLVNQLIEAGQLTEEEAETFEHNNIILQALGTADTVQVDLTYVHLRRGDRLMLCSDGLSGMVRFDEIRETLLRSEDPLEACKVLTDKANQAGGHDNITVIVAKFDGPGLLASSPSDEELKYRKYPLPEETASETTEPNRRATVKDLDQPKIGADVKGDGAAAANRGDRMSDHGPSRSKVAHTMIGANISQFLPPDALDAGASQPAQAAATPSDRPPSARPPAGPAEEDPIFIPTTSAPWWMVAVLVVGAIGLVTIAGFYLLKP
jgi:serine/threonine protein phosphatase PrpC